MACRRRLFPHHRDAETWQNRVAEQWVESIRRELDHVIPLNEAHLFRLTEEYIRYYHQDRTHIAFNKDSRRSRR